MILFDFCSSQGGLWETLASREGVELRSFSSAALETEAGQQKALEALKQSGPMTAAVYSDYGMNQQVQAFLKRLPGDAVLIPIGPDAMLHNPGTVGRDQITRINTYVTYGGEKNLQQMFRYIRHTIVGEPGAEIPEEPEFMPFDGIFDVKTRAVYEKIGEFLDAQPEKFPRYAGMLVHRSVWLTGDLTLEKGLSDAFAAAGVGLIPVFCSGETGETLKTLTFPQIVSRYFTENGRLKIGALVNFQMHLVKGQNGKTVAETSMELFQQLGVPVFHPITSYFTNYSHWKESSNPLSQEMPMAYGSPEMAGVTEPMLLSLRDDTGKGNVLLPSNLEAFAGRVKKWMVLREKPAKEKKLALMLHNSVCSGVEANIGKAFGLDAFESTVALMRRLRQEGYAIEHIPENGKALQDLILGKKAISDFRWTSVEDIADAGGCLYRMPTDPEYLSYFREFSPEMQQAMLDSWGPAPGEGMVLGQDLIITGLKFGNLLVMVQPKRGCYGAKCTGEVCRILHDPACPPAHQYIATYRYLERVYQADAVIHLGTDGSLEYLPGKSTGLTNEDWPYAVLGSLPNIYPYHLGVTAEGTIAKRRANAVMVGYYPASAGGFREEDQPLMETIRAYCEAADQLNGQEVLLQRKLEDMLSQRPHLEKLMKTGLNFREGVEMVRDSLLRCAEGRKISNLHTLGENPDRREALDYLTEVLWTDGMLPREEGETDFDYAGRLRALAAAALTPEAPDTPQTRSIREIYAGLMQTAGEMDSVVTLLSGGFLPASEGGMPDENGRNILPTGRNFYMMNMDKIPTRTAYDRGVVLADQLLDAYRKDAGKFPEKIAMNMISLDISRTQGEQMCQFLNLLGIRPQWDSRERVIGLEAIPVQELGRPRIDVTLRISGVMRDTWPDAVELLDEAVLLAASQPETEEENYVLANIHRMETECGDLGQRSKTIRIFGDPPGAFGAGIDLALKASAWESDEDLARYFIQSSAFAYGKGLSGRKSIREFVQNAKNVELTTDVTSSRRMDTLACGFGLQVHGGFKLISEQFGGKKVRQYQSLSELGSAPKTQSLSECIASDVQQTLLNPAWVESVQEQEYMGGSEILHRIQNVFDTQCTSRTLSDDLLNQLADAYVNDDAMREWLMEHNRYAAEEIGRRLLELESRGRWAPDQETLENLQSHYLELEGFMEGEISGKGEIQAGSVEIIRDDQVENWKKNLKDIDAYLDSLK